MPVSRSSVFIPRTPAVVYAAAKDIEALKPFLPSVQSIEILEKTPQRSRTRFVFVAVGRKISYIEVEEWDDAALTNRFWSPEGDFDKYEGHYGFAAAPGGAEFSIDLEWELNIPLIGNLIKSVIAKLVQQNLDELTNGMRSLCESRAPSRLP